MQQTSAIAPPSSSVTSRLPLLSESRWAHLFLLALPFVLIIVGTHGLNRDFNAFQAGDEGVHYQIVQTVIRQWPHPLLKGYDSWEGPLVYWLLATLSRPFGSSFVAIRLVVAAFSWGTCAVAYVLLRDRLRAGPLDALALTLLLVVSPLFFGQSFHVLTDNPTWFFVVLGLERLFAYLQRPTLARMAGFAACLAAATLMRQIAVWLVLPALVTLMSVPVSRGRRLAGLGLIVLGVVPLAALLTYWGALLPSGGATATSIEVARRARNLLLSLGVVGTYALIMIPTAELVAWARRAREHPTWLVGVALPAVGAGALLAAGVLNPSVAFIALLTRVDAPQVAGVSLFWWVLVPLGTAATAALVSTRISEARSRVLIGALLGLLLSAMANPRWFERYLDFPTLLVFAGLSIVAGVPPSRADRLRWLAAGLIAIALFVWVA